MRSLFPSLFALGFAVTGLPGSPAIAAPSTPNSDLSGDDAVVQLAAEDARRSIELRLHQHAAIQLKANPSTGYAWVVLSARNVRVDQPIEVVNFSAALNPTVGQPGVAMIKAVPLRVGRGVLILGYKRPWESRIDRKLQYRFDITR